MDIFHQPAQWPKAGQKVCLAIGVFDGVHLGHRQVIRQTLADAEQHEALAVVVTFDRHPNAVVAPERVPPAIYSLKQKLRAMETLGAAAAWVIPFDAAFSRQTGEEFVRDLKRDFAQLKSICVGESFAFGCRRSGNVALLTKLGEELQFLVHGLASVALDGQAISSTRIRETIRAGQFDLASQMLGRAYALAGEVMHGDQVGTKLGYPTANVDVRGLALPPLGVYAVHARLARPGGTIMRGVLNLGVRPTLSEASLVRAEVHLLDYQGDLYEQELEITFVKRLRDERKFGSLEELKAQIASDVKAARALFER